MRKQPIEYSGIIFHWGEKEDDIRTQQRERFAHKVRDTLNRHFSGLRCYIAINAMSYAKGVSVDRIVSQMGYVYEPAKSKRGQDVVTIMAHDNSFRTLERKEWRRQTMLAVFLTLADVSERFQQIPVSPRTRRYIRALGKLPSGTPFIGLRKGVQPMQVQRMRERTDVTLWELMIRARCEDAMPKMAELKESQELQCICDRQLQSDGMGSVIDRSWGNKTIEIIMQAKCRLELKKRCSKALQEYYKQSDRTLKWKSARARAAEH